MKSINIASNEVSHGYWKPSSKTKTVLTILTVIAWIIFVGLCIQAGGLLTNAFFVLAKPESVKYLWQEADLKALFNYNQGHFFSQVSIMAVVAILKAYLFYRIISILHDKRLTIAKPFTTKAESFISASAFLTLLIGLFSVLGTKYTDWLRTQNVKMPDIQQLNLAGADVWLFMCVILFVIAQIFKKGTALQTENELTV